MKRLRHLKLIAAVTVVLLALTGFSQARSSGGRGGGSKSHSSGHGGGGCSSKSSSSHSHSAYRHDDTSSGSGSSSTSAGTSSSSGSSSGNAGRRADGSGYVTECARAGQGRKPAATVRVRNAGGRSDTFAVEVHFLGPTGEIVDTGSARATVKGGGTRSVTVPMATPAKVRDVRECEVSSVR